MTALPFVLAGVLLVAVAVGTIVTTRADRSAAAAVEADLPDGPTWTAAALLGTSGRPGDVPAESAEEQTIEIPVVPASTDTSDPAVSTDVFAAIAARPRPGRHWSGTWRPLVEPGERYTSHRRRGVPA